MLFRSDNISIVVDKSHHNLLDVNVDGKTFKFKRDRVHKLKVAGGAGNDIIKVGAAVTTPSELDGGTGDDSIVGGGGADTVKGDAGNDTVSGGTGDDDVDGGKGNDHCDFGQKSGVALTDLPQAVQDGLNALAQGATIDKVQTFHDNGQTFYGTVVTISGVKTRIVVGTDGSPVTKGTDKGGDGEGHHGDSKSFGSVVSVDTGANTITISVGSEHAAPQNETFTLAAGAAITADGAAVTLADLAAGTWVRIATDPNDATIATAISAISRRAEGNVTAVDASTITVAHDHGIPQVFNVDSNTKVVINGVAGTLADITVGMEVHISVSSLDATLATGIQADGGDNQGGPKGGGPGQD